VTSDKARDFLGNNRSIRMLGSVVLGACSALYCTLAWRTYEAAAKVARQIALLNTVPDAVYRHAVLSESSTVMLICANVGIAVICIWVLQKVPGPIGTYRA